MGCDDIDRLFKDKLTIAVKDDGDIKKVVSGDNAVLKDLVTIFNEDGLAHSPDDAYALYCFAHKDSEVVYKCGGKTYDNVDVEKMRGRWQRLWLKNCLADKTDYVFHVLKEEKICRENEVRHVVTKGLSGDNTPLAKHIIGSKRGLEYYRDVISDWYLDRHNIAEGTRVAAMNMGQARGGALKLFGSSSFRYLLGLFYLVFSLSMLWCANATALRFVEALTILFFVSALIACVFMSKVSRFFLPRLVGAVMIGHITLVVNSLMGPLAHKLENWELLVATIVSLVVAVLFLMYNSIRSASLEKSDAFKKAVPVALYGFSASVMFSLIVNDLIVHRIAVLPGINPAPAGLPGIFGGTVYPDMVVFSAAFAFLIAILIHLLWHEKPVTKPL